MKAPNFGNGLPNVKKPPPVIGGNELRSILQSSQLADVCVGSWGRLAHNLSHFLHTLHFHSPAEFSFHKAKTQVWRKFGVACHHKIELDNVMEPHKSSPHKIGNEIAVEISNLKICY